MSEGTGLSPRMEKKAQQTDEFTAFVEHHLNIVGRLPSLDRCKIDFPHLSPKQIDNELKIAKLKLQAFGYEITAKDYLDPLQLATAETLLNLADRRPRSKKLAELGVSAAQFANWKKSPAFNAYLQKRSEKMLNEAMPDVHLALIQSASSGDVSAMKLFYELTGRHGIQNQQQTNIQALLVALTESVQENVDDPEILQRIAASMQRLTGGAAPPIVKGELE